MVNLLLIISAATLLLLFAVQIRGWRCIGFRAVARKNEIACERSLYALHCWLNLTPEQEHH
jgi:hypothetical protein